MDPWGYGGEMSVEAAAMQVFRENQTLRKQLMEQVLANDATSNPEDPSFNEMLTYRAQASKSKGKGRKSKGKGRKSKGKGKGKGKHSKGRKSKCGPGRTRDRKSKKCRKSKRKVTAK